MTKKYTGGWGGRTWKERYGKMGDGGEDEGGRGGEKRGMEVGEVRWVK